MSPLRERWLLITLAGIQFTNILDFMIMMPLGPALTALFHISDAQFGMLVSAYTLAGGASGLLASTYIDKFDRKRLLLVLYSLFAISTFACGIAPSYETLLLARISAGIFGGVLSALSQTIVGDVIPFERRGHAMGIVMTSFSVSTVAGVPLGLFLAAHFGWHIPFLLIAGICVLFAIFAYLTLPALNAHLQGHTPLSAWSRISEVLQDHNHLRAFAFSALLMFSGFTVIPYITIFMQTNVGLHANQVPYVYLCGGVATLVTARWLGNLTDSWGKFQTFRAIALVFVVPLIGLPLLGRVGLWGALVVSTLFFICGSGRMIPGMAMLTSAANPALRGTFMTLNASIQSAAMGLAALVGGHLISRNAEGLVQDYWKSALIGAFASILAVIVAKKLKLNQAMPKP
jgi:predicted MFS family arabinose efflux permease